MLVFPRWVVAGHHVRAFPINSSGSLLFHTSAGFALELRRRFLRFALELRRRFLRSACATFRCAVNCDELPEYCAERLRAQHDLCQASARSHHHYHIIHHHIILHISVLWSHCASLTYIHPAFKTWLLPLLLDVYWTFMIYKPTVIRESYASLFMAKLVTAR